MTSIIQQLRDAQAAGDAVTYYTILEQNGDLYGKLAKGVVMSDAMAGTIARAYAGSVAASVGVTLGGATWAQISLDLMALDLAAREDQLADSGDPLYLGYDAIQDYHSDVFDDHGLPADAWTANIPLNQSADPEATWQSMLQFPDDWFWGLISGSGTLISESDSLIVLARLSLHIPATSVPSSGQVSEELFWAYHTVDAFMHYVRDQYGGASMGNVEPFAIDLPGGKFIGGADQVDDVLAGTQNDDVIIGFRGDDILGGLYGHDRIYGGEGDDYVHAGPDGGDLLYGGDHDVEGDTVHFNENWQSYLINQIDGGFSLLLKGSGQLQTQVFEFENFDFANLDFEQASMVLTAHAYDQNGGTDTWTIGANAVFAALSDPDVAEGLGIQAANGKSSADVMKDMIASTVLPGYPHPFGDVSADVLVADMQALGSAIGEAPTTSILHTPFVDAVATSIVEYAAALAKEGVTESDFMFMGPQGVISVHGDYWQVGVDPMNVPWQLSGYDFSVGHLGSAAIASWFSQEMGNDADLSLMAARSSQALGVANGVDIARIVTGTAHNTGNDGRSILLIATGSSATLTSGNGDDLIIGSTGDDVISGGLGNNVLIGADGNDAFHLGGDHNIVLGGDGVDTVLRASTKGATSALVLDVDGEVATITTVQGLDAMSSIERIKLGIGDESLIMTGGALPSSQAALSIDLGAGDDFVDGTGVHDVALTLIGGEGANTIVGGAGGDTIYAGYVFGSTSGHTVSPTATNLVQDGSFEDNPHIWNPYGQYHELYGSLYDSATWTWTQQLPADFERQFVQVYNGQWDEWQAGLPTEQYAAISEGTLSQTISTTVGMVYDLTWMMASHWSYGLDVRWNGVLVFDELTPSNDIGAWTSQSVQVVGTGNDLLSFTVPDIDEHGVGYYVQLDQISLRGTMEATNRLSGFLGDDLLVGNATTVDHFLYASGFGDDAIRNVGGDDLILIDQSLAFDFSNLLQLATQDGSDCLIQFGQGESLRIEGMSVSSLDDDLFLFCDLANPAVRSAMSQDWGDWLV